jgi:hypothetical protein
MVKETVKQISVVYIPRKLHPNGLLNYKMVIKPHLTGLSFMFDFNHKRFFLRYQQDSHYKT